MLVLAIKFRKGTYRASPWLANAPPVEWPPAPWRLLRMLTHAAEEEGILPVLWPALSLLREPPEYRVPPVAVAFEPSGRRRSYRGEVRFLGSSRTVLAVWRQATLDAETLAALAAVLRRVTYFGSEASAAEVSGSERTVEDPSLLTCTAARSQAHGLAMPLLAAGPDTTPGDLRARRPPTGLPPTAREVCYVLPPGALVNAPPGPDGPPRRVAYRYRLLPVVRFGEAYALAEVARRAAMAVYGRLFHGSASAVFSGKDPVTSRPLTDHRHAHFLPTDEDGDGGIDHLTVYARDGFPPREAEALETLAFLSSQPSLDQEIRLLPVDDPAPHLGPARTWRTHLPFVPVRHPKRRATGRRDAIEDQVRLELARRGLPPPIAVQVEEGPESDAFRAVSGPHLPAGPRYRVTITFSDPVHGPVLLGAACHFGLGQFLPLPDPGTDVAASAAGREEPPLLPARMLNAFAYCPRLMYLEWVDREWTDSEDTVAGTFVHRRVDEGSGPVPAAQETWETIHSRSVELADPELGLIAKIDLLEGEAGEVVPVDYKRGSPPDNPERSWEPERVQLCAQALILRSQGFRCVKGVLFYVGSRQRVEVPIDDDLVARTLELVRAARAAAAAPVPPPPLVDSPKCPRCSLVGICLPDEVTLLSTSPADRPLDGANVRLLFPSRPESLPLYVSEQGSRLTKNGERLVVRKDEEVLGEAKLIDVSQVCVFGAVGISTPVLQELARREIPVVFLSHGGYFYGVYQGLPKRAALLRVRQFAAAADPAAALPMATAIVQAKIHNQRVLLRRNGSNVPADVLSRLQGLNRRAASVTSAEALLGIEGAAASLYYGHFATMLSAKAKVAFDFHSRNRRPPKDPVNAVLSLGYALLAKDVTVTLFAVGLDPYVGIYHHAGHGRPALALDLMEEFRPVVVDSMILTLFNRSMLGPDDFISRAGAVSLTPKGRRTVIEAYETRLATEAKHPVFGYSISYRRALEVQARLFARALSGELTRYMPYRSR